MADYGYWNYAGRNGLEGAESTVETLPDGTQWLKKNPEHPCVLEDEFILFAVRNDHNALTQFNRLLPTMDAVSLERLQGLVAKHPGSFKPRLDETAVFDNIQRKEAKRGLHVDLKRLQKGVNRHR